MTTSRSFLNLFHDKAPALRVSFELEPEDDDLMTVPVQNILRASRDSSGRKALKALGPRTAIRELLEFYEEHDGCEICKTFDSSVGKFQPILEFKPAAVIASLTRLYMPGGKWAWTIDLNKSHKLYRGSDSWIVFAEIGGGPLCLTLFLTGENVGKVFYLAPQPQFNILRPIAQGFSALLDRIAKDPAAFLRLVRGHVVLRGKDGHDYGLRAYEYIANEPSRTSPRKQAT
jgi:hypothetical protein